MTNINPTFASPRPKPGEHIGAIDCGSNAIRFSIFKLTPKLEPLPIVHKRYPVRLGTGTFTDGTLAEDDISAALEAFREIKSLADEHAVITLPAVATSAIRDASNARAFLDTVAAETGINLRIISGDEEADLITAGVNSTISSKRNRTIIDVGGGSTEVIRCKPDGTIISKSSLPLGAVRLAREVGMPKLYNESDLKFLRGYIGTALVENGPRGLSEKDTAILVGGTARALAEFCIYQGFSNSNKTLGIRELMAAHDVLIEMAPEDILPRSDIERKRAAIIVPGMLVLLGTIAYNGITRAKVSDAGVREGLVANALNETRGAGRATP